MRQAPAFEDHGGRPAAGRALTGGWQRCGLGGGGGGEREGEKGRQLPLSPPPPPTQVRLSVKGGGGLDLIHRGLGLNPCVELETSKADHCRLE